MKKLISVMLVIAMFAACLVMTGCGKSVDFTVGVCQLMSTSLWIRLPRALKMH